MRILHLSDTHVTAAGTDEDGVASTAALERMLADAGALPDLDLVVVSGDIADDGSTEGCAEVRDRVGRFAAERGIPHVYCTGNHDTRDGFGAALGTGHLDRNGDDIGRAGPDRAAISHVGDLRVITLDSLVPGAIHGVIPDAQLAWLRAELATPAPGGSVVMLHHPPIAPFPALAAIGLHNPDDLGAAVAGTDVLAVLCGHFHLQLSGTLHGVPVWVTPGVVTRADLTAPPGRLRVVTGAGASVVEVGGPSSPLCYALHARDPEAGTVVFEN
ncbi:metallophosphoesterase family protein [Luedemannella helvata]|uniref:Metallophosphoesterase n=1 Tax=Luedemannella helvata TaxID=349315 RepID=A0ABP4X2B7_9ACTN